MSTNKHTWSGITAPVGSALRSAQLIVDHHVGIGGKLIYGPDALAEAIASLASDRPDHNPGHFAQLAALAVLADASRAALEKARPNYGTVTVDPEAFSNVEKGVNL